MQGRSREADIGRRSWSVLLVLLAALVLHLTALTASVLADADPGATAENDAAATPAGSDVAPADAAPAPESPAPGPPAVEPETGLGPASPEPAATADAPAADKARNQDAQESSQGAGSTEPNASEEAPPPASDKDISDAHQPRDQAGTGDQPEATSAPSDDAPGTVTPEPADGSSAPAPPTVLTEAGPQPHTAVRVRAPADIGVAAPQWQRPIALAPDLTPPAWGRQVGWRPPRTAAPPARRAGAPATPSAGQSRGQVPLERPAHHVPHTPSSSVCGGSSSCAHVFQGMLPLLSAVGMWALLFESLAMVASRCRPRLFLSLRERPG